MRHLKKGRKLGTDASHTKAMKRSLAIALFTNERIKTTEARAKEVRTLVDKIITWGKKGDVHSRRLALAELGDRTRCSLTSHLGSKSVPADTLGS
jgi:large subunit ribosomal protein L17